MLTSFFTGHTAIITFSGILFAVILCFCAFAKLTGLLPTDHGRAYAVEGSKSKGKPTGAGVLFISIFAVSAFLFVPFHVDYAVYYLLIVFAMLTGYFDDKAPKPWSEYKKAILDMLISLGVGITFACTQSTELILPLLKLNFVVPVPLYAALATIVVWIAINAANCTDGVDGLSASVFLVSTFAYVIYTVLFMGNNTDWNGASLLMIGILFSYLWFNTNPSSLLMGDAGSRAMGVFLAVTAFFSKNPFTLLIFCLLILADGLSGITKIFLKRFLKISILKNTTTPFHDHFRKNKGWANQQVTVRFTMVHIAVCGLYFALLYLFR